MARMLPRKGDYIWVAKQLGRRKPYLAIYESLAYKNGEAYHTLSSLLKAGSLSTVMDSHLVYNPFWLQVGDWVDSEEITGEPGRGQFLRGEFDKNWNDWVFVFEVWFDERDSYDYIRVVGNKILELKLI